MKKTLLLSAIVLGHSCLSFGGSIPGDISGPEGVPDCIVNNFDLAVVARYWLQSCPTTLPVLTVESSGVSAEVAMQLGAALGVEPDKVDNTNGMAQYLDPVQFQMVPTMQINPPDLSNPADEGEPDPVYEAFDFDAMKDITPPDDAQVMGKFKAALDELGLTPENGTPIISHTLFEAFDINGESVVGDHPVMLDTQVYYNFEVQTAEGLIPLVGPGAQACATFNYQGKLSHFLYANRKISPSAQSVEIMPLDQAAAICSKLYPELGAQITPRLIYPAPPLSTELTEIIPCYVCEGTAVTKDGELINLLEKMIPATTDPRYNMSAEIVELSVDDDYVSAMVNVNGGVGPFSYNWSSSTSVIPTADLQNVSYRVLPRISSPTVVETLTCQVTGANGQGASVSETFAVVIPAGAQGSSPELMVGGVKDYGVERAVSDLGGPEQAGYIGRMDAEAGMVRRFNWTGNSAWEKDFKDSSSGGLDHIYVDNVDQILYIGHGNGNGFSFTSSHDDTVILYDDPGVQQAWGDKDLEWLVILSCQVLKESSGGKMWYQRWGPTFDGLHLLLGYQTNASANTHTPRSFAQWQLGKSFGFITISVPVRAAWCLAKKEQQPAEREAVVMGPYGTNGVLSGFYDYFHGEGPVGPDLRANEIAGFWRIVYK